MQVTPIFSVGTGMVNESSLLPVARQLFADNQQIITQGENGLRTTLQSYNSRQNCMELNNQKAVETIKEVIKKNAIKFYSNIGFDVEQLDFEVVNLWLNEMASGASHGTHSHYGYQVSGCFYVDVPQGSNLIKLYTPIKRLEHGNNPEKIYNQYNAQFFGVSPNEGDMYFWESLLVHEVPDLEFHGIRRSIAYDVNISRKVTDFKSTLKTKNNTEYKMNLQDYVAIYNINDSLLCRKIVNGFDEKQWVKHAYSNPITNVHTTYEDDLDITYQNDEVTNKLQVLFEQCAKEYTNTHSPLPFQLQALTELRFNRYNVGTNMKMHHDHIHTIFDGERRGVPVLTMLGLLNDDFEGGDFLMFDNKKVRLSAGDIIVFPSSFIYPHAVTTVTKGTRYSCVSWGY
jgi:uncharacterized protein (TIGR02466 family)